MSGFDHLSDDDILRAAGMAAPPQASAPAPTPFDHLSDDDILAAAAGAPPPPPPPQPSAPQMGGLWREPAMAASSFIKNAVEAVPGLIETAARSPTPASLLASETLNDLSDGKSRTINEKLDQGTQAIAADPTSLVAPLDSALTKAGVANRSDLEPQGNGERYLSAAAGGAGAAVPFALTGGAPAFAMNLARGTSGGIGAQLGHDIAPNSKLAPLVGGMIAGTVPDIASAGISALTNVGRNAFGAYDPSDRATAIIAKKMTADNIDPSEIGQTISANPDKPLTIADLSGPATQRMARASLDIPSEGSAAATQMLQDRDAGAGVNGPYDMFKQGGTADRVVSNIKSALGSDDAFKTTEQLLAQRKADSGPAYDKAFQGGSLAPLEDQFQGHFADASAAESAAQKAVAQAQQQITNAAAKQQTTGNVYGTASANGQAADAAAQLRSAQSALSVAQGNKAAILARLQQAQADGTANAPGAVWNPRIQQFLNDPIMKGGLNRGLQIQRLESLANGEPFNPSEYAITGADAAGNPTVGSVPNMRLLDAGKRGLDAIIQDNQDPVTGKVNEYGRAVDQVRRAYLGQLDNANPDYKAARMAYSGPTKSIQAIEQGQKVFNTAPETVASTLEGLAPEDQSLFRIGVQKALISKVQNTADGANEVRTLFGNPAKRASIAAAFDNPEALNQLSQNLGLENRMYQTKGLLGGSRTAPSALDQADLSQSGFGEIGQAAAHAAGGNWKGAIMTAARPLLTRMSEGANADTTSLLAQRLLNPDQQQNAATLALVQALMGQQPAPRALPSPIPGMLSGSLLARPTGR